MIEQIKFFLSYCRIRYFYCIKEGGWILLLSIVSEIDWCIDYDSQNDVMSP